MSSRIIILQRLDIMSISLKMIKIPIKIAMNGMSIFRRAGEAARIVKKQITQMATGNQAAIKKITIHLLICRSQIKTMVMTASTMT